MPERNLKNLLTQSAALFIPLPFILVFSLLSYSNFLDGFWSEIIAICGVVFTILFYYWKTNPVILSFISKQRVRKSIFLGVLLGFLVQSFVTVFPIIMRAFNSESTSIIHPLFINFPMGVAVIVLLVVSVCEEFYFRGILMDLLQSFFVQSHVIIISSVLFGLSHLILLKQMSFSAVIIPVIGATALGLLAGFVRLKSDNLIPGIIIHISYNAVGFILYYTVGGLR